MRKGARAAVAGALVGMPVAVAVAFALSATAPASGSHAWTVTGTPARAVAPGSSVPLDVTVDNRLPVPVVVTTFQVAVARVRAQHPLVGGECTAEQFVVQQSPSRLEVTIKPFSRRSFSGLGISTDRWPQLKMRPGGSGSQRACENATLTLDYSARRVLTHP